LNEEDKHTLDTAYGRFALNIVRVLDLIEAAQEMPRYESEGSYLRSDMLRAAVVLSHAALEDLVRSLIEVRLPHGDAALLQMIPMIDAEEKPKPAFDLRDLAGHRGHTVSEVIRQSVVAYLSRVTYNNVGQVAQALDQIGLPRTLLPAHGSNLAAMMNRRHHIVHRADRNDGEAGSDIYRIIETSTAETWVRTVENFGSSLLRPFFPGLGEEETK
jgi:hypothetical protein